MVLVGHRTVPNRARENRERVWARAIEKLRGKSICSRCGCTLGNMDDRCEAGLGEKCPGLNQIELARVEAAEELGLA